jgi:aldose 1-epimerase
MRSAFGIQEPWAALLFLAAVTVMDASIQQADFGRLPGGTPVKIYTLSNRNHVEARITNYGGIVVSLKVPDRNGNLADVVLGFDSLAEYLANPGPYFGALIGRYANRIAQGRFRLDGVEYHLDKNNGPNTLHGGAGGFDKKVWTPRELPDGALELQYRSRDGESGFPGNLIVTATYRLTDANELRIDYSATTDRNTVLNLTSHSYFNLRGAGSGDILSHLVTLHADRFTPVDASMIPTGELRNVAGTPFDFRNPTAIGARIGQDDEQLKRGNGYDHNWLIDKRGNDLVLAARVEDPESGRVLEVHTTEPGIQFYTANFLDGTIRGKGGKIYPRRSALCLETQHFPDSPNHKNFPSTTLRPGDRFQSATVYRFLTARK